MRAKLIFNTDSELRRLWSDWLGRGEAPPAFDRFFTTWLRGRATDGPTRAALGAALAPQADALLSWGVLASFERFAGVRGVGALMPFTRAVAGPRELLRLWRAADERFFRTCLEAAGSPPPLSQALEALGQASRAPEAWCVAWGVPPWHAPMLAGRARRSGEAWAESWLRLQGRRPPLWLRVSDPTQTERVAEELRAEGLTVRVQGESLHAEGPTPINHTSAWTEGRVEVQDLGSQEVGRLLPLEPGAVVWDSCAGVGGKTLQLAARLGGRGAVHASDVDPRRLTLLRQRGRRAGVQNVRTWVWDGRSPPTLPPEVARRGGFDGVLVDAPCAGSGTWRRKPDGRARAAGGARWAEQQRGITSAALGALRPGGALVYATCSVAPLEDEAVVEALLGAHPELSLESTALYGAPAQDADTLFAAVLRRR